MAIFWKFRRLGSAMCLISCIFVTRHDQMEHFLLSRFQWSLADEQFALLYYWRASMLGIVQPFRVIARHSGCHVL